jgi:hypothetical protein
VMGRRLGSDGPFPSKVAAVKPLDTNLAPTARSYDKVILAGASRVLSGYRPTTIRRFVVTNARFVIIL